MPERNLGPVSLKPKGEYNSESIYTKLDLVSYDGGAYVAKKKIQGIAPEVGKSNNNWQCISVRVVDTYADAVLHGYTGTREEFGELIANLADTAKTAAQSAEAAAGSAQAAETSKKTAAQSAETAAGSAQAARESETAAAKSAEAVSTLASDLLKVMERVSNIEKLHEDMGLSIVDGALNITYSKEND